MNILVVGAAGFIGRHLVWRLFEAGHDVTPSGTDPARLRRLFPGLSCIAADYGRDSAESRAPRLAGVDVVINAAGLIRETGARTYRTVHTEGPIALFEACVAAGGGRVLQISALGADAGALTLYHLSKRAADDRLAALDPAGARLDWCVLRPSLVLGPGGRSTALFAAIAAAPLPIRLGPGTWRVQPIHIDDLTAVVERLLERPPPWPRRLDLVGPEPVDTDRLVAAFRHWLGEPPRPFLRMPVPLLRAAGWVGDRLGAGPLTGESLTMLMRGNVAPVAPLIETTGYRPKSLEATLAAIPCAAAERWRAKLSPLRAPLRISLALLWIASGLVSLGLYPLESSLLLLGEVGLAGAPALAALYGAALWDLALGGALLVRFRPVLAGALQLATMIAFTLI
ncbi:MAG TPA: NAD-dependent epimerase/dehydratase family protein, partial [Geminicoccaceae bacterium]|nr:NAD-dependent epimerase/dehydratase family protein [Geminicoccaceae bacterium]